MRSSGLNTIFSMAKEDRNIIFIGSDLGFKVLEEFKETLPDQFFMEGISEQNIIGMAAGMALNGKTVYINTIASFLTRRCLDQISINLCLEKVNVRLFANGGGLIYGPMGPTHTIIEDIALMMSLPNMSVVVPCDRHQMISLLNQAHKHNGPMYIRVARDNYPELSNGHEVIFGEPLELNPGKTLVIISNGYFSHTAMYVSQKLKEKNMSVKVIDLHTLSPLNTHSLLTMLSGAEKIVTMEEHIKIGGIYSLVSDLVISNDLNIKVKNINLPKEYSEVYGEQDDILKSLELDKESVLRFCQNFFEVR